MTSFKRSSRSLNGIGFLEGVYLLIIDWEICIFQKSKKKNGAYEAPNRIFKFFVVDLQYLDVDYCFFSPTRLYFIFFHNITLILIQPHLVKKFEKLNWGFQSSQCGELLMPKKSCESLSELRLWSVENGRFLAHMSHGVLGMKHHLILATYHCRNSTMILSKE